MRAVNQLSFCEKGPWFSNENPCTNDSAGSKAPYDATLRGCIWCNIGLPYVRFLPDMSGILVAKYASGRNVKQCFIVQNFGIMRFMKSNRSVFAVRII